MPNIEVHGCGPNEFNRTFRKIVRIFKRKPYADFIVVTDAKTEVYDLEGCPAPLLRVYYKNNDLGAAWDFADFENNLERLGFDVELQLLRDFERMRPPARSRA